MKIDAPFLHLADVKKLAHLFQSDPFYFVGGCVRNHLLDVPVTDLDVASPLRPEVVIARAEAAGLRAVPTGIDHGTVTVVAGQTPFEVTTFRRDVETDGRRAVVAFADTIEEDAARRDFTMNALYLDMEGQIFDPTDGLKDLRARSVRFIGQASERIREDALRILRFFRFHASYGAGALDRDGLAACAAHVQLIETLSKERIGSELKRLLVARGAAPILWEMEAIGALGLVVPDAVPNVFEGGATLSGDALYRIALLQGRDEVDALRLSRAEGKRLAAMKLGALSQDPVPVLGYKHGKEDGYLAAALRAALSGEELPVNARADAALGASQIFPLKAADLSDMYEGRALGEALRCAEHHWIETGFAAGRADLIAFVQAHG